MSYTVIDLDFFPLKATNKAGSQLKGEILLKV